MKIVAFITCAALLSFVGFVFVGCARDEGQPQASSSAASCAGTAASNLLLAAEPADARNVTEVAQNAQNDEEVVVVGRIGGSVDPWVEGMAAFDIVDMKLIPCSERPDDQCPTPWDYCCDINDLPTSTLAVRMVDDQGKPIKSDARELLGVKELQTVVVRGKLKKAAGSLAVAADGVYIKN